MLYFNYPNPTYDERPPRSFAAFICRRKEYYEVKEAAITQSPHAFVPKEHLTDQEREELYRTRLDESFRPYTVIDVITKVYHRSFEKMAGAFS